MVARDFLLPAPAAEAGGSCGRRPGKALAAGRAGAPGWASPPLRSSAAEPPGRNLPLSTARSSAGPAGAPAARLLPCMASGAVLSSPCFCCFKTSREQMYKAAGLVWRPGKAAPAGRRLGAVQVLCWEGLGGGGAGLGGPTAPQPWGTWQGTRVKWLSQPLLLVEAEPGAGVASAGFLGMVVHHCSLSAAHSWWGRPVPRETQPWLRM